ncbi:hypothetical protein FBZ98_101986 [Rhizobium sp. ERR 922]|uniref:hypothetical protein n=1 Tax=unclassified Rhizobium TaxID=2613769 RepID=UPI0011A68DAC|nr:MULTISPECIES: hypothetical protein [unclassified Rhizobium]TWB61641.1 hypothetical protein FBZ98_101986 [Rhizobium sp. ERR 922]TWC04567.1 hypothetical protein FBZ97_101986 [Rhizobium sp. ERR 942]
MITPEMVEAACEAMAIKVAKQDGVELSKAGYRHGAESRPDEHERMREYVRDALEAAIALLPGKPSSIDRQKAADAAVKANHAYGQWMPERWLHLFLDAYEGKL